uniref:Uncharacterized protein n=1 Tax=Anopheles coluzzii TaxID=1518534 RepID=A0A8W7PCD8_ANOCL
MFHLQKLHEQFEQLVLNVEHCLRQGQWDGTRYKIVREAHRMACMLANSWTELIVDELPEALVLPFDELLHGLPTADWPGTTGTVKPTGGSVELLDQAALLGVWHYEHPEAATKQLAPLIATLLQVAKFQSMYELRNVPPYHRQTAGPQPPDCAAPVKRFIQRCS